MTSVRILIVSNGALCRNPRVLKEATTLGENGYDVTVLTIRNHAPSEIFDREILASAPFRRETLDLLGNAATRFACRASRWLAVRLLQRRGWESPETLGPAHALLKKARALPADLTIVHNEVPFWIGPRLISAGRRVAADFEDWYSEDLLPEERRQRPLRLLRALERQLLSRATYTSTTSQALAEALHARYGGVRPEVITNSFPLQPAPQPFNSGRPPTLFWFSQTIGPGRGLEFFLQAWQLTRHPSRLVLLGRAQAGYKDVLLSQLHDKWRSRISLIPLVSPAALPAVIAQHDIGLALEESSIASRDLTITNKILQYLNAGLAVVATGTAGQREVLADLPDAGLIMPPSHPQAWAERIDPLLSNPFGLAHHQRVSRHLAETLYCWERQAPILLRCVSRSLAQTVTKSANAAP